MIRKKNQPSQPKQNNSSSDNQTTLTFLEHFYELRKRLFLVALTLAVTTAVGLEIKDWLIAVIVAPLQGARLIYLTPGGGFSFIFTLSLYFGVLVTIPVITYHMYRFLQPMLKTTSRRFVLLFVGASTLLALLGAGLAYFLAIPSALGFLNDVSGNSIIPNLTADSYLRFVVTYMIGLAILFQLPLLLFLFDHIRPIPPGTLGKTQRYGIVASSILAALITPSPDLMNYAIVLFPIIGVYELGVLLVVISHRVRMRQAAKSAKASSVSATKQANDTLSGTITSASGSYGVSAYGIVEPVQKKIPITAVQAIDGITKARQAPELVQSPSRQARITERFLAQQRQISKRQLRSVDGFVVAQNKSARV